MARKTGNSSSTRRWHRGIGVGASLFVVFLVVSGLALNHASQLGLDRQHVSPRWLLRWYGIGGPEQLRSFAVDGHWLSFAGSQLYLDDQSVATASDGVGATIHGDWLVAASTKELLLLNRRGELIERLPWDLAGAAEIEAIGHDTTGEVVVQSDGRTWLADTELLGWSEHEGPAAALEWSVAEEAPPGVRRAIVSHYSGNGLSVERLVLDIHSGRIFGRLGMFVYDVLALILGFSAVSGLVLWWRTRGNGNGKGRNR